MLLASIQRAWSSHTKTTHTTTELLSTQTYIVHTCAHTNTQTLRSQTDNVRYETTNTLQRIRTKFGRSLLYRFYVKKKTDFSSSVWQWFKFKVYVPSLEERQSPFTLLVHWQHTGSCRWLNYPRICFWTILVQCIGETLIPLTSETALIFNSALFIEIQPRICNVVFNLQSHCSFTMACYVYKTVCRVYIGIWTSTLLSCSGMKLPLVEMHWMCADRGMPFGTQKGHWL